jgi:hypothetical protein
MYEAEAKSEYAILHELFQKLDKTVLEKGNMIYRSKGGPYRVWYWPKGIDDRFHGSEMRYFQLLRFEEDDTILRGLHKVEGVSGRRVTGWPECKHVNWEEKNQWKDYILFKKGDELEVVSDESEIKKAVKNIIGIDLPKIDTRSSKDEGTRYSHERFSTELYSDKDNMEYHTEHRHWWVDPEVVIKSYKSYLSDPERLKEICSKKLDEYYVELDTDFKENEIILTLGSASDHFPF